MKRVSVVKIAILVGVVPVLLWAYEFGPNPGYAGVPGENGTCVACHFGKDLNAGGGSVTVNFPNGMTYTPGVTQQLSVTIADPTQRVWGFELTARPSSSATTMAGTFASTDNNTRLMCSEPNLFVFGAIPFSGSSSQACASTQPLQYMEQSVAGYNVTKGRPGSASYTFNWTPPSTNVGNVIIYVAANAANGDLTPAGDHIYSTSYTLTPADASSGPTISGISNAASGAAGVVPSSFVSIYGSGFTTIPLDTWSNSIANGQLPTQLDGISVTIGGKPAYINAITPGQINVQAPDVPLGNATVTVTNSSGASATFSSSVQLVSPALFPWPNNQPVATHADFSIAAANGTFSGQTTVPAKPGEIIILWGTGFGPTMPTVPTGQVPGDSAGAAVMNPVSVSLDGTGVQVISNVLSGFPGEYQIAIQIPASMTDGNHQLVVTSNGVSSPAYTLVVQP
ncbi:MAG TPA: choice-of-anchor V domain-containing protein [Bryobacteraceae bacterium]|jgi:uncharacterized protein (TIGR03437 family)